jgi:uncharacterized protein YecT (DUF1311 family)
MSVEMSVQGEAKQCPECGETILAVAKRCKHCQATLSTPTCTATVSKGGLDIGSLLLVVPVVATLLVWFWIGNMNLLQSPGNSLALVVVATVAITAILASMEASKVGATADRKKGTYSPLQWFFVVALLWVVGYPAYLLKRKNYGLKSYLWAGLVVMVVFSASVVAIQASIDSRIDEIKAQLGQLGIGQGADRSLPGMSTGSSGSEPKDDQSNSATRDKVTALMARLDGTQTSIAEYYETYGSMPSACAQMNDACLDSVSVGPGGRITLSLGDTGDSQLVGKSIMLTPSVDAKFNVAWICASDADARFVPTACRKPLSQLPAPIAPAATAASAPPRANAADEAAIAERSVRPTVTSSGAGPSFDCAKPTLDVEKRICSNPQLASADAELAAFYKRNLAAAGPNGDAIKQGQRAFVTKRDACSDAACIAEAYRARYEALAQEGYVKE